MFMPTEMVVIVNVNKKNMSVSKAKVSGIALFFFSSVNDLKMVHKQFLGRTNQ